MKRLLSVFTRLETSIVVITMLVFVVLLAWQDSGPRPVVAAVPSEFESRVLEQQLDSVRPLRDLGPGVIDMPRSSVNSGGVTRKKPRLPNRSELARRAALVEIEANHELDRLVRLLDIDEHQQDQVFSLLVEKSPYFDSAFEIQGGAPLPPDLIEGSYEAGLSSLLGERHASTYANEEANRRAWWTEIVESLIPEEDLPQILPPPSQVPQPVAPSAPSNPLPSDPVAVPKKAVTRPTTLPIE